MARLFHLKDFINSPKTLEQYLRKSSSKDLINLLNDLDELQKFAEDIKFNENPIARSLKYNLSEQDYQTLIKKLKLLPREEELLTLSKKEKILNFINILATVSFSSFGFVGLFTALGMVVSIELLGVLLAPVFAISFLIAIIWNYQLASSNKEAKENQKLLDFRLKILQQYNTNEWSKLLDRVNILNREFSKLQTKKKSAFVELTVSNLSQSHISPVIAENLRILHKKVLKLDKPHPIHTEWNKSIGEITTILQSIQAIRAPKKNEHINTPISDPDFFQWFKNDTRAILLNLFSESKSLLGSVLVGTTIGLVILKLVAQGAILSLLLTTPAGVGILAAIIAFIVLTSMIFILYNMYNQAKRDIISNSTKNVIKQQDDLKAQFVLIEKEFEKLFSMLEDIKTEEDPEEGEGEELTNKVYDTIFMKDIVMPDKLDLINKVIELLDQQNLRSEKIENIKSFLANNDPRLTLKLFKKLKGNIISSSIQLDEFLNKYKDATTTELAKIAELNQSPPQVTEDIIVEATEVFEPLKDKLKEKINNFSDEELIKVIEFLENRLMLQTDYNFVKEHAKAIQTVIQEVAKRLTENRKAMANDSDQLLLQEEEDNIPLDNRGEEQKFLPINSEAAEKFTSLRLMLDRCKTIRKKVLVILIEENKKLQAGFEGHLAILKKNSPELFPNQQTTELNKPEKNKSLLEEDEPEQFADDSSKDLVVVENDASSMQKITKILNYEPQTVTINELIDKKHKAAEIYAKTQTAKNQHWSNFWQPSYQQHQKVAKTFEDAGIKLRSSP